MLKQAVKAPPLTTHVAGESPTTPLSTLFVAVIISVACPTENKRNGIPTRQGRVLQTPPEIDVTHPSSDTLGYGGVVVKALRVPVAIKKKWPTQYARAYNLSAVQAMTVPMTAHRFLPKTADWTVDVQHLFKMPQTPDVGKLSLQHALLVGPRCGTRDKRNDAPHLAPSHS